MAASLEQFVQHQLQSGKDQSYDELLQASLQLLQKHEEELDRVAEALRPALQDSLHGDRGRKGTSMPSRRQAANVWRHLPASSQGPPRVITVPPGQIWSASGTPSHISGAPCLPGSVAWKGKADAYPQQTGSSICRSSPQEGFDEG